MCWAPDSTQLCNLAQPCLSQPWLLCRRFLGGVLGTKFSPRTMLGGGLAVTALVNLAFGASGHSVALLTGLWFLNGALQVGAARHMQEQYMARAVRCSIRQRA